MLAAFGEVSAVLAFLVRSVMADVTYDADDLAPLYIVRPAADRNALADRFAAGPEAARELFINDRNARGFVVIGFGYQSPFQKLCAETFKVSRSHIPPVGFEKWMTLKFLQSFASRCVFYKCSAR